MRIRFKAPDPRAGTVVQMDSSRGQHFIDTGAAVLVKDDDSAVALIHEDGQSGDSAPASDKPAPVPRAKKAADSKKGT